MMNKVLGITFAAAMMMAAPVAAYAQTSVGTMNSNSASSNAPGQQMKSDTTGSTTGNGASDYAPGPKKKLPLDTSGSTSSMTKTK